MERPARLAALLVVVAAFTLGVMVPIGAPGVAIVSGLFGALVPVGVIYGVMVG